MAIDINQSFDRARRRLAFGEAVASGVEGALDVISGHLQGKLLNEKQRQMMQAKLEEIQMKHSNSMEALNRGKEWDYRTAMDVAMLKQQGQGQGGGGLSDKERGAAIAELKKAVPPYATFRANQKQVWENNGFGQDVKTEYLKDDEAKLKEEYIKYIRATTDQINPYYFTDPGFVSAYAKTLTGVGTMVAQNPAAISKLTADGMNDLGVLFEPLQKYNAMPTELKDAIATITASNTAEGILQQTGFGVDSGAREGRKNVLSTAGKAGGGLLLSGVPGAIATAALAPLAVGAEIGDRIYTSVSGKAKDYELNNFYFDVKKALDAYTKDNKFKNIDAATKEMTVDRIVKSALNAKGVVPSLEKGYGKEYEPANILKMYEAGKLPTEKKKIKPWTQRLSSKVKSVFN